MREAFRATTLEAMTFERPLGLVLTGGGALGSWEAGCLQGFLDAGLRPDRVLGYSSGALAGAGGFLGAMDELTRRWRRIDEGKILRFAPKISPLSLFSGESLFESASAARDEEAARRSAAFDFTVVTVDLGRNAPAYHRFTPGGAWDGPLEHRLVASASIPVIFPPVEIGGCVFSDGGIPCGTPLSYASLAGCRTVVVVEMVRPEERGRRYWNPVRRYEQQGREAALDQADRGVASLLELPEPPRVHRLRPSRVLEFSMLDFKSAYCSPALDLGIEDARRFLESELR